MTVVAPPGAVYELQGLRVRSEVPLPASPLPDGAVDAEFCRGPVGEVGPEPPAGDVVAELAVDGARYYTAVRTPTHLLFRAHGLCDFVITPDLRRVEWRPDRACDPNLVPILLAGTVLAFLLGMAGRHVLHGSAVEIGGRAVAFVGHSGSGKSTMAALLCAAGGLLLSDDLLHLDVGDRVTCLGRSVELRLRPTSMPVLDGFAHRLPTRPTADGKVAVGASVAPEGSVRLDHLIVPQPSRTATEVQVRRLVAAEAVLALTRNPRIVGWRDETRLRAQFELAARLAEKVPVSSAVIPWGPPFPPSVAADLLARLD